MNPFHFKVAFRLVLALGAAVAGFWPAYAPAQIAPGAPWLGTIVPGPVTTPDAQRQAVTSVRNRVSWLKNAMRTAPSYATGADGLVWRSFVALRVEFVAFTRTLTQQQISYGANELGELGAGLDILEEAFVNYNADVGAGRPANFALRDLCQVLGRGVDVWLMEFNGDCTRLRVGR